MRHTQAAIRRFAPIMFGAAAFLLGGASAPAAPARIDIVGDDSPAWSPDGSEIAFTSFRNGRADVYVMKPDGTDQRRLTTSPAYDDLAAWSPDGRRIAFTSDRSGSLQVWMMNADGSDQRQLTFGDDTNYFASWSPDGSRIAFRSDRDGNAEIYSMKPDGSDALRLTHNTAPDYSPCWGPDGRILFVHAGANAVLWVMNGDGGDQHRFTPASFFWNQTSPVWSPDGKHVLFQADRDGPIGNTELYVMNADGTGLQRLTHYPGQDNLATWSPDGKEIAFARGPTPYSNEIYLMNSDGSDQREVTKPRLRGVDIGTIPARPTAGHPVLVAYDVEPASGADFGAVTVKCSARANGKPIALRSSIFLSDYGRAACLWNLPRALRGKIVRGSIAVRGPAGTTSQPFSFRVG